MITLHKNFAAAIKRQYLLYAVIRVRATVDGVAEKDYKIRRRDRQGGKQLTQGLVFTVNIANCINHKG